MTTHSSSKSLLVDWSSAIWAGLVAGSIFLLLNLFWVPQLMGGNAWVVLRLFSSPLLGSGVLAPPATFDAGVLVCALLVHFTLSIFFSLILAFITHRWGLITGILVGGLFGLAVYAINIYTVTLIFPWFYVLHHKAFLITHVFFGMCAGGVYETLEVEEDADSQEVN